MEVLLEMLEMLVAVDIAAPIFQGCFKGACGSRASTSTFFILYGYWAFGIRMKPVNERKEYKKIL